MIVSVQGGGLLGADEGGWLPNATMPQSRGEGEDCAAGSRPVTVTESCRVSPWRAGI